VPTKEQVLASLNNVVVPGAKRSVVDMNLVRDISIENETIDVTLAAAALNPDAQEFLKDRIEKLTGHLEGVKAISVKFEEVSPQAVNNLRQVIAIMSGKGGVGKSLVSGLTAVALRRLGYSVGILDADITGPSIPRMFGIHDRPDCSDNGILPLSSGTGIEVMSVNLLLPEEDEPVIWRGPVIAKVIAQFYQEVLWGTLDFLIVDLPPGTADVPLTVLQQMPLSGIIIVSSPQDLASMIVKKAVNMARKMDKPIIGVVENMSYLYVPEIHKNIELFGKSKGEAMAREAGAPLLARIPIDPALAALCDVGKIEDYTSDIIETLGRSISAMDLNCQTPVQECQTGKHNCDSCNHDCKDS
jgi:Mrp family chromosome partitioning ATPase